MEITERESINDVDAVMVAVLRIFAARGRAIRAERAKLETARKQSESAPNASDKQEQKSIENETGKQTADV
jgi:hypothetical protein